MRHARRRDDNEPAIIEALRAAGAFVEQLNGKGTPDLLVLYRGTLTLLEVKNLEQSDGKGYTKTGKLTEDQTKWWAAWGEPKPTVVYTADEALGAVGAAPDVSRIAWDLMAFEVTRLKKRLGRK